VVQQGELLQQQQGWQLHGALLEVVTCLALSRVWCA
jgi:hypothetical protein